MSGPDTVSLSWHFALFLRKGQHSWCFLPHHTQLTGEAHILFPASRSQAGVDLSVWFAFPRNRANTHTEGIEITFGVCSVPFRSALVW